jgi:iron complex outermembrane receptor protein
MGSVAQTAPKTSAEEAERLPEMVVTATREAELLKETPASIGILKPETIRLTGPAHPQQILGQIPGVAISVTNGEGHQTAIRQPFTTAPLYLFLEDGIPVRPTGFFNHNALYEVNIPMAGGIEVVRGPGSALYGSDAIGGIINVLSSPSEPHPALSLSGEAGSYGWRRLMGSVSSGNTSVGGFRGDINLTHTDGWRDRTAYDRQSGNFRWDTQLDADTSLKTIASYTNIDQGTGANTPLPFDLYKGAPTTNLFSVAYRKVEALRISSQFEKLFGDGLLSVTPYFRNNSMDLNGSFNLNNDPRIEKTESQSYGLLTKWRHDFPEFFRSRVILGLDLENSPGSRTEDSLTATSTGAAAYRNYTGYTIGRRIYDYDVTFKSVSPYLHTEISPLEKLRVTAGARFDSLSYDFENHLPSGTAFNSGANFWGQTGSTSKTFERLSPKLGLTYELTKKTSLYGSYNRAFRVPSESQLFRGGRDTTNALAQARATSAVLLKPIKADEFEIGLRGELQSFEYTLAAYNLVKRDDIVSYRDTATNITSSSNAGKTESRGVELSLGRKIVKSLKLETSLSYAKHEYKEWVVNPTTSYSGNEIPFAPRFLGNTRLTWTPLEAFHAQLEWVRIGSYFLQDSNAGSTVGVDKGVSKYDGYDLFNFRANYTVTKNVSVFTRVMNIADKRYADSASVASSTAVYSPGLPRTFYGGLEVKF